MKIIKLFTFLFILSFFCIGLGCGKTSCPSCDLEPDSGPCKASISKYYFDKEEKKCKEFIWGGCDGVVPFDTMEECEECNC